MSVSFSSSSEYIQLTEIIPTFSDLEPGESVVVDIGASAALDTPLGTSVDISVSLMPQSDCEGAPGWADLSLSRLKTYP